MSRPTLPADDTQFASPVKTADREPDVTVELRMGRSTGSADPGFVVEWQLLPLVERHEDRREPKRSRAEKSAPVRLVDLGWQG